MALDIAPSHRFPFRNACCSVIDGEYAGLLSAVSCEMSNRTSKLPTIQAYQNLAETVVSPFDQAWCEPLYR